MFNSVALLVVLGLNIYFTCEYIIGSLINLWGLIYFFIVDLMIILLYLSLYSRAVLLCLIIYILGFFSSKHCELNPAPTWWLATHPSVRSKVAIPMLEQCQPKAIYHLKGM